MGQELVQDPAQVLGEVMEQGLAQDLSEGLGQVSLQRRGYRLERCLNHREHCELRHETGLTFNLQSCRIELE
jgi:hypothetical protein